MTKLQDQENVEYISALYKLSFQLNVQPKKRCVGVN